MKKNVKEFYREFKELMKSEKGNSEYVEITQDMSKKYNLSLVDLEDCKNHSDSGGLDKTILRSLISSMINVTKESPFTQSCMEFIKEELNLYECTLSPIQMKAVQSGVKLYEEQEEGNE